MENPWHELARHLGHARHALTSAIGVAERQAREEEEHREQEEADAIEAAQEAFWRTLSDRLPYITTGDLDPLATHAFQSGTEKAARQWIALNRPPTVEEIIEAVTR